MPVKFKISPDGGNTWMDCTSLTPLERGSNIIFSRDGIYIIELSIDVLDFLFEISGSEKERIKNMLPQFVHIEKMVVEKNNPQSRYPRLIVFTRPYTEAERYAECLDFFISNLPIDEPITYTETWEGRIYSKTHWQNKAKSPE